MTTHRLCAIWLVALCIGRAGAAEAPAAPPAAPNPQFRVQAVDDAWRARLPREADAATRAYMERLPADVVARADSYFEGGYWLQLWNLLLGLAVSLIVLGNQRSARLRDWAARVGRKSFLRDAIYGAAFSFIGWVLTLPLLIYQGYFREHAYAMATQSFGPWFAEQLVALGVSTLIAALAVGTLYAVFRRAAERWWLWGTVTAVALTALAILISPVWIDPLFNTYKKVENGAVRDAVLAMAWANGVPVESVYEFDASRQTTRVSANVSGIFGSAAVRLNDNLLRRSSLPEIRAVMGHELGHYVLNHVYKALAELALLYLAAFLCAKWAMDRLLARYGGHLGLKDVGDVASLPMLAAVFSLLTLAATPITNTLVRTQEIEADRFGLNLSREPLGMAEVDLKLTEYRKPDPGPIEELIFFDHPSTRFRVHDAMRWREAMGTP